MQQMEKESQIRNGRDSEHADGVPELTHTMDDKGAVRN